MLKNFSKIFFVLIIFLALFCFSDQASAATFNDAADGNWNSGATWGNDGNDVAGSGYPSSEDTAVIDSNAVALSADQTVSTTTISGGTFDFNGKTLSVTKNWDYGSGTLSTSTAGSTLSFSSLATITGSPSTLNNLTFNTTAYRTITIDSGADLTAMGTTTYIGQKNLSFIDTGVVNVKGDLVTSGSGGSGTATFVINGDGDQTISGSGLVYVPNLTINKPSGDLTLSGTIGAAGWNMTSMGTGTFDAGSSSVSLSGTVSGATTTFNNLDFTDTTTIATGADLIIVGTTTFSSVKYIYTGDIYALGDIAIGDVSGGVSTGGLASTAHLIISGTDDQAIVSNAASSSIALPIVVINKSSGDLSMSGFIGSSGWTMTSMGTGTFDAGTSTLYLQGNVSGGPTTLYNFNLVGAYVTPTIATGADLTVLGTTTMGNYNGNYFTSGTINVKGNLDIGTKGGGGGTLVINGDGDQVISSAGGLASSITIDKSSGKLSLSGFLQTNSNFTVTSLGTGSFDATSASSTVSMISNNKVLSSQGILAPFDNLIITNHTILGSDVLVRGTLTINASRTLTAGTNFIMVTGEAGDYVNNGTLSGGTVLIGPPSISLDGSTFVDQDSTDNSIAITGVNTPWRAGTPGTPTFTLSGGTDAALTAQVINSTTTATLTIDAGSTLGDLTITDPSTGATTTLSVGEPGSVPILTTDAATSVSVDGATLNATLTAQGSTVTQSGFGYGTDSTLSTVTGTTTLGSQSGDISFSSDVSSLSCGTTYYFRAYATNGNGTGYGDILSFSTDGCSSEPTTVTASTTNISATSATLNGSISDSSGGDATQSGFEYGTDSTFASTTTVNLGAQTGNATFSTGVSGLTCNTYYYARAFATNAYGKGYGSTDGFLTDACSGVTTYYVSKSGDDSNPGSKAEPWLTVQHAADVAEAGDVVNVAEGIYNEKITFTKSGTAGSPIVFQTDPSNRAIIDGTDLDIPQYKSLVTINGASYITFSGFEVRNSAYENILINSNSIRLKLLYLDVHDGGTGANRTDAQIMVNGCTVPAFSEIAYSKVHDGPAGGIALWTASGGYWSIHDNEIYNNEGYGNWDGLEIGGANTGTNHVLIKDNNIYNNGYDLETLTWNYGADNVDVTSHGLTHHIFFEGNRISTATSGPSFKIHSGGEQYVAGTSGFSIARRNDLISTGLGWYSYPNPIVYYNNTFVDGGQFIMFYQDEFGETASAGDSTYTSGDTGRMNFKNNIFFQQKSGGGYALLVAPEEDVVKVTYDSVRFQHNLYKFNNLRLLWGTIFSWYNEITPSVFAQYQASGNPDYPDTGSIMTTITAEDMFTDYTDEDFSLVPGSPAIDAGMPLTTATNSGNVTTTLTVDRASYFIDGYCYNGECLGSPDSIRIGNNSAVQIAAGGIDDANNVITLSSPVSWSEGDPVTLEYYGSAPDIGAYESGPPTGTFTITASAGSNGSISPSGEVSIYEGSDQSFTITPDSGYEIDVLTVDGSSVSTSTTYSFEDVAANHSISVTFKVAPVVDSSDATLSNLIISQGALSPTFAADTAAYTNSVANSVSSLTVTPTANQADATIAVNGSAVDSGSASNSISLEVGSNTITIVVTAQDGVTTDTYTITVTRAEASAVTHDITSSAGSHGSISPSGTVTVNDGDNKSFTITPDSGYKISDVLVDGSSVGAISSYQFSNVVANHTISATFALTPTSGGGGGGGGSVAPSSNEDEIVTLYNQVLKLQKILMTLLTNRAKTSSSWLESNLQTGTNPVDSYYFTSNLKVGSQGKEVKALQTRLNNLGYIVAYSGFGSPGQESQYFGQATKKALARFQLGTGIISSLNDPAAGIFGPKTRAEMNEE